MLKCRVRGAPHRPDRCSIRAGRVLPAPPRGIRA